MKCLFSFLLFLSPLLFFGQTKQIQSGEVIYKLTYLENVKKDTDSIKNAEVRNTLFNALMELKTTAPYIRCKLYFNSNEAIFKHESSLPNDNGLNLDRTYEIASGHGGTFYTNLNKNFSLQKFNGLGKIILMRRQLDSLRWHITNESKTIKGYTCKKAVAITQINAISKEPVIAWFTTELPFQFGPLQFVGLPGLILGLERNGFYFYASKISFKQENILIHPPQQGTLMSKQAFYSALRKAIQNNTF